MKSCCRRHHEFQLISMHLQAYCLFIDIRLRAHKFGYMHTHTHTILSFVSKCVSSILTTDLSANCLTLSTFSFKLSCPLWTKTRYDLNWLILCQWCNVTPSTQLFLLVYMLNSAYCRFPQFRCTTVMSHHSRALNFSFEHKSKFHSIVIPMCKAEVRDLRCQYRQQPCLK